MHPAIGIDVGATNTKIVAVAMDGGVVHRARMPTHDATTEALSDAVRAAVGAIEREFGRATAIGVASPGLVRPGHDVVHWMQGRLAIVQGLDWTRALRRETPVRVLNDAQAALLGEAWIGAGRGCRDVVMLTLGTGVGGAVLAGGTLLTGSTGRAGHLGHIALQVPGDRDIVNTPGSLEGAIGDCTVRHRSRGRFASTEALVRAHLDGDSGATAVWDTSVMCLAAALASIINAFDPERIILGGGIAARAGEALTAPLARWMEEFEWRPDGTPVPIVPALLGDEAGAIGVAWHARHATAPDTAAH